MSPWWASGTRCYGSVMRGATWAIALLAAALGCSTSSGAGGGADASPAVSDDPEADAGDDASGGAACAAAGGQCEVGAVCEGVALAACGPVGSVCCLHVICPADAKVQLIQETDYDQSCTVDSDCVEVFVGNACSCELGCRAAIGPINKTAEAQYTADVANAPHVVCSCVPVAPPRAGAEPVACCLGGQCQTMTGQCPTDVSAPDAGLTDAGAEASRDAVAE
jgi:hypothetical protein